VATLSTLPPAHEQIAASTARPWSLISLWHLTSLDAPTVAVVWMLAFAWAARIRLPIWLTAVLALAAWSFYIGDRLLDARNARTPLRARHHFHWHHRRIFLPLAIASAAVGLALVFHSMPLAARERNSVLAAAALAYFGSVHFPGRTSLRKFKIPKELLVGILFTLACAAPVLARIAGPQALDRRLVLLPALVCFIALAWLNCHAIESWESATDERNTVIRNLGLGLAVVALLVAAIEVGVHDLRAAALLATAALSAFFLAWLDRHRRGLDAITLRAAADLVLLTPLLLLAAGFFGL
jgi:hypothetical protein